MYALQVPRLVCQSTPEAPGNEDFSRGFPVEGIFVPDRESKACLGYGLGY